MSVAGKSLHESVVLGDLFADRCGIWLLGYCRTARAVVAVVAADGVEGLGGD